MNKILFNQAIKLKLDILRVDAHTRKVILELLKNLEKELVAKIVEGNQTQFSQGRIKKQLDEINLIIASAYKDADRYNLSALQDIAQVSASSTHGALIAATGNQVDLAVLPTLSHFKAIAAETLILGANNKDWWRRLSDDAAWKFKTAMQQGLAASETSAQIVKRVRENMDISKRNAMVLIRTAAQTVSNEARMDIFKANSDVVENLEWVATLDLSTCPECAPRDGKQWTLDGEPDGHAIQFENPPIHYGCRCMIVSALKPWREMGIDMDGIPKTTRASMNGIVEDTSFGEWLKTQSEESQNEVLGIGRASLWRDGTITLEQLLDQKGNAMTLTELKNKYL
jgi:SPP1 gp7 family putative phage head morphogenesis protein